MKRIGLYVDVSNLYYCLRMRYHRKLDYTKLVAYCEDWGDLQIKRAYGSKVKQQAKPFINFMKRIGFECIYRNVKVIRTPEGNILKGNQDIRICMDILEDAKKLDAVVLCTADGDFAPLVKLLTEQGVEVYIVACGISTELHNLPKLAVEIPESFMEG